ncbi:MAG: FAD-dependent oxidoreductase [Desulfosoma sp.]
MSAILRDPEAASRKFYDVIVIGGGIYGAFVLLEASLRGLQSLLVERRDFGTGTSFNSLRIIHGGLRYLQQLDLPRFRESVSERRWFLENFPDLVHPMPCLMPLYANGLHRPEILRAALLVNDFLSRNRNRGLPAQRRIPNGRILDPVRTEAIFPMVDKNGLKGGAVWYDAFMPDSPRLLQEVLRRACSCGGTALNYVRAVDILTSAGSRKVAGITAEDLHTGRNYEFRGRVVVNACGPRCRSLAERFHRDIPKLFRPSLAWNVLFDRPALSDHALAVTPRRPGARTYFILPWQGKIFAGTGHAVYRGPLDDPCPTEAQLEAFIADVNTAVQGVHLSTADIARVFSGLLPAKREGEERLAVREVIIDHGKLGGPDGLYSISGVKFTTARLVAEKTIKRILKTQGLFQGIREKLPCQLPSS